MDIVVAWWILQIVTALLGGPAAATAKISAIDKRHFGDGQVQVRRYQLTPRTRENDNVASVHAFGRLYKMLATDSLQGLETFEQAEICSHLTKSTIGQLSRYQKGGYLPAMGDENPGVVSAGGFCRRSGDGTISGVCIYAINVRISAKTQSKDTDNAARNLIDRFVETLANGGPMVANL
eukprot:SAG31_NODE_3759_length_3909_cov_2.636220_3_plen_179_part_00